MATREEKAANLEIAKRLAGNDEDRLRILVTMQGAERTDEHLIHTLCGVNSDRDDLSEEDDTKVAVAIGVLNGMVSDRLLTVRRVFEGERVIVYYGPCAELKGRVIL